jgi:Flp pilus assembly protein TadG
MRALISLLRSFSRDRSGNVALMFGITLVPLLMAVGAGIDYSMATRMKAKLQSAADAAAVASVSANSPGYIQASLTGVDGPVPNGISDADSVFHGVVNNLKNSMTGGFNGLAESSTVTKTGPTLTSMVTFSAKVPTTFMNLFGYANLTVTGSSSASGSLPPYLDFYLLLDVSGSMGLPSTPDEANRMQWVSPDNFIQYPTGCTLACHFTAKNNGCTDPGSSGATQGYPTNGYCLGYLISRVSQSAYQTLLQTQSPAGSKGTYKNLNPNLANYNKSQYLLPNIVTGAGSSGGVTYASMGNTGLPGSLFLPTSKGGGGLTAVANCPSPGGDSCIQLRLDAVGYALTQLFQEANNDEAVTDQFQIGLYPFITNAYTYVGQTTSISSSSPIVTAAQNLATLLDTNTNANLGSGGTHIDNALTKINTIITSVGTGTSTNNRLPYVFLVTDGAIDPQSKTVGVAGGWSGSNHATTLDKQGTLTTISQCEALKSRNIVVSILNIPYQTISPVNASFANDEDDFANNNIQYIRNSLQKCASPGYYYEANTPQDINDAMVKMFKHALQSAHITN